MTAGCMLRGNKCPEAKQVRVRQAHGAQWRGTVLDRVIREGFPEMMLSTPE